MSRPLHVRGLIRWSRFLSRLLATFMGICKVKDDNIVQAMQQAQADKIDNYPGTRRVTFGKKLPTQPWRN